MDLEKLSRSKRVLAGILEFRKQITGFILYENNWGLFKANIPKYLKSETKVRLEYLISWLSLPILIDDIEDMGRSNERRRIKKILSVAANQDLLEFYLSNKLRSEHVYKALITTDSLLKEPDGFPKEFLEDFEFIHSNFSQQKSKDKFNSKKYVFKLKNRHKLKLVENLVVLVEKILCYYIYKEEETVATFNASL